MPIAAYLRPKTLTDLLRRQHFFDICRTLLRFAVARMKDAQLQEVASSMTLTTLLSLVPLLAVSLAVFAAFPSFESTRQALEDAIFNSFLPPQYSETILEYLRSFTSHASGLRAFGIAGLSLTGLLLIDKFFVTVNRIFKVRELRPWSQRALIYWAMLTLGPVVMALSISIPRRRFGLRRAQSTRRARRCRCGCSRSFKCWFSRSATVRSLSSCPIAVCLFSHALAGGFVVVDRRSRCCASALRST